MTIYWQFYFRVVWNVLSDGVNIVFGVWRNGGKLGWVAGRPEFLIETKRG